MSKIKVQFTDLTYIIYRPELYHFQIKEKLLEKVDGG